MLKVVHMLCVYTGSYTCNIIDLIKCYKYVCREVWRHAAAYWLRLCVTSRKVSGSSSDEVVEFLLYTESCQPHYGPRIY
jgi:hypothetical protein